MKQALVLKWKKSESGASCARPVISLAASVSPFLSLFLLLSLLLEYCGFDGQQILEGLAAFNSQMQVLKWNGGRERRGKIQDTSIIV